MRKAGRGSSNRQRALNADLTSGGLKCLLSLSPLPYSFDAMPALAKSWVGHLGRFFSARRKAPGRTDDVSKHKGGFVQRYFLHAAWTLAPPAGRMAKPRGRRTLA